MKVLLIGPHKSLNGGVASVSQDLLESFESDPDVSLIELSTIYTEKKLFYPINFLVFFIQLIWLSINNRFDLAHIHLASKGSAFRKVIAMALLCMLSKKYLVHLHGAKFDEFYLNLPKITAFIVKYYMQRAIYVVALSKSWENWISEFMHLQNTRIISNGSHSAKRHVNSPILKKMPVCLFGGRLEGRKGPEELLFACSIPPLIGNIKIWFAGDGNDVHYKALAEKLGIIEDCEFFGWMPKEEYYQKLNQADVFILPSFAEGMPMSIIEAMSAGIPSISTIVGGIPELIQSGKTGILVEPGNISSLHNAIKKIFETPCTRPRMSKACKEEYTKNFTVDKMFSSFKSLYIETQTK